MKFLQLGVLAVQKSVV